MSRTLNFEESTSGITCDDEISFSEESDNTKKKRKGLIIKSIVENDNCVFISLDLERRGDKCVVTQLYTVLFRLGGFDLSNNLSLKIL